MSLISIQSAAEILDVTERHVLALVEAGELRAVDTAIHAKRQVTKKLGADGKRYPASKRRLRIDACSIKDFIARRTIGKEPSPRPRRTRDPEVIEFV